MGHIKFDKGQHKKGMQGFYLALAICLAAVGGVAVMTFVKSMSGIETETGKTSANSITGTSDKATQAGHVVTNIPDIRTTTTKAATRPSAASTSKAADLFILPLSNEVIRGFGGSKPVYFATMKDWRVHSGVDFAGSAGQSVKALADGKITSIYKDSLWGNVVTIDHGYGIKSKYCGVRVPTLKVNSTVKVGNVIGTLSNIPCEESDGFHLHLEITVNGEYVDPVEAVGREVKYLTTSTAAASTAAN